MAPCAGEIVMANSTTAGSPAQITAEYLSEHEPLELLIFQPLKRCDNSQSARRWRQRYVDIDT
jgi:hypothetical protein